MVKTQRKKIHEAIYYLMVLVVVVFISAFLFFISPVLYLGHFFYMYIVLLVLGVSLGAFLKEFLKDLDELTHKHHAGLVFVVLVAATLNFVSLTASFSLFTTKSFYYSLLSAFVFTISFLIPYSYQYLKSVR